MDAEERIMAQAPDGAQLELRRFARPGRPRLLLSHGNGFAIDGYRAFWRLLADEYELILFDLRNHGRNRPGPLETHTVAAMASDHLVVQAAVTESFGPRLTVGLFHSVSSIAAIMASVRHRARWDALILIDPPLIAPPGHPMREQSRKLDAALSDYARNRRQRFVDPAELAAHYRVRIGRDWVAGADLDMARAVTRPDGAGGFVLSCPGEYEARIYGENARFESFEGLASLRQPALIVGADPNHGRPFPPALIGAEAAAAHKLAHVVVEKSGHMLQIERPEIAAAHVRAFVSAQAGG